MPKRPLRRSRNAILVVATILPVGLVWVLQYALAPTLVVGTGEGLQSLFQVVAAAIVAIFALVFGSLFVLAQQLLTTYGQRALPVLMDDWRVRVSIALGVLLTSGALLLAGQVPNATDGAPDSAVTAGAGTLAIVSCVFLIGGATMLGRLLTQYGSSERFREAVVADANRRRGGPVPADVRVFRQALRTAARRAESLDLNEAATGLLHLLDVHYDRDRPRRDEKGPSAVASEVSVALERGGEDALRAGALLRDLDRILTTFRDCIDAANQARREDDAAVLIDGLAELAAFGQQLPAGTAHRAWVDRCVIALAEIAAQPAPEEARRPLAARAVANWALASAVLSNDDPPQVRRPAPLGADPPVDEAEPLIDELARRRPWRTSAPQAPPLAERARRLLHDVRTP